MLLLDIYTLIFVFALGGIVSAVGLLLVTSTDQETTRAIRFWIAANIAGALASVLTVLRGQVPDLLTIVVANALFTLGALLYYQALLTFYHRPTSWLLLAIVTGAVVVSFTFFTFVVPDEQTRIALGSASVCGAAALCVYLLGSLPPTLQSRLTRSMVVTNGGLVVIWSMRLVSALTQQPATRGAFEASPLQSLAFAVVPVVGMFHTLAFVLLIHERAQTELRRLASVDALTGVFNRRAIENMAAHMVAHAKRARESCAVVILDADDFKGINDTYGHATGDQVLRDLVRTMVQNIREQDMVGRIGGEEFVVVLPGTGEAGAAHVADRLRSAIANSRLNVDGHTLSVTISAGVAALAAEEDTAATLMQRADQALYTAKMHGRNRVSVAPRATPA
jgi:diguanylate cyclase (GGDEF)-like protein